MRDAPLAARVLARLLIATGYCVGVVIWCAHALVRPATCGYRWRLDGPPHGWHRCGRPPGHDGPHMCRRCRSLARG